MANILELKIESTLEKAGIDAAKQGVAELQGATGAASGAMASTAGAATTALKDTGAEAGKTATAVKTVEAAAKGAAAGVVNLSTATTAAASATTKLGTAAAGAKAVTSTAKGAATAMAGVGTAAAGAGNEAVSSLNLMSMGANILTGNIMGTIQASTEMAGHFKGISMIKFSGVALAIAGIATAWQWVTNKIKEFNAELAKSDTEATDLQLKRLRTRYDEITKAVERYAAAQDRIAGNVDAFQDIAFDRQRQGNAQRREAAAGASAILGTPDRSATFDAAAQDIDNAERLYQARIAAGRATKETAATEAAYNATVRATNSEIRALNDLYSKRAAMKRQAETGSTGGKAYAEEALKGLEAQIAATEAAVKEGKAKTETLRAAKEQAPVEEELARRRLELVEADIKLTNQARERTRLAEFQAAREAARVSVAEAVASAEEEVVAARKALEQAEKNEAIRERTRELEKQAQLLDKQAADAKKLLQTINGSNNRARDLEKREKQEAKERARAEKRLRRNQARENRDMDRLAERAGGKAIIDPTTGEWVIHNDSGKDITHRLNAHDRKKFERLAKIRKAEEAQNNGKANAARQQIKDMNNPQEAAKALQALQAAEKGLATANDALRNFDAETAEGLEEVRAEVAAWRESAAGAIAQASSMSNQVIEKLTAATEAQTSTLSRLLVAS